MKTNNSNNNSPYSWFNPDGSKPKLSPKQYMKIALKFIKISFFIVLLMLTVTACGQNFSIRTQNNIGNGVEFYHGTSKVQPFSIMAHEKDGKEIISEANGNSYRNSLTDDMKTKDDQGNTVGVLSFIHSKYKSEFPTNYVGRYYPIVAVIAESENTVTHTEEYKVYGVIKRDADGYKNISKIVAGFQYNPTAAQGSQWSPKAVNAPLYDENSKVYQASPNGSQSSDISKKVNTFNINAKGLLYAKKNTDHYLKTWRPIVSWASAWHYGPWYGLLVFPIFASSNALLHSFSNIGILAVIITIVTLVLLIRSFQYALSFKSMNQSYKMQEVQGQIAAINAKYTQYKDNPYMLKKKQAEIMEFYKRENINPFAMIIPIIFTMPFFLTMWRVIEGNPIIKTTSFNGLYFSVSSWAGLSHLHWIYLIMLVPALIVQVIQVVLPMELAKLRRKDSSEAAKKAAKKQNKMVYIMVAAMFVMCFIIPAGMSIYWVASGLFTIVTQLINHFVFLNKRTKVKKN